MIVFIILTIIFGLLAAILYKSEHNIKTDGCCEGTIYKVVLEDSGDYRYYIKAEINGIEREGKSCTYERSPKGTHVGQTVKVEYCLGKRGYVGFDILETGFIKRSVKSAYVFFGILSIVSFITFIITCISF